MSALQMTYITQMPQKSKPFIRHSLLELSPILCIQNSTSEAPRRESTFNHYSVWACFRWWQGRDRAQTVLNERETMQKGGIKKPKTIYPGLTGFFPRPNFMSNVLGSMLQLYVKF